LPLEIKLSSDEAYHLPFLVNTVSNSVFACSLPPNFRRNIYILTIGSQDPVTIDQVLDAFHLYQVPNATSEVAIWIIKSNNEPRTYLEEQPTMFNQGRFAPVLSAPIPDLVACRAVISLLKPDCPEHVGHMARSPWCADLKKEHFKHYDKMYEVSKDLLPLDAITLPVHSTYSVKSTVTDSLWELQLRSCAHGARMIEGVHYDQSYASVATIDSARVILSLYESQYKQVYNMDIRNEFHNTIEFDPSNHTYSSLPPFFVDYIRLRWAIHPELVAVEQNPYDFVIQNFCYMQSQKYAGQKFYQLMYKYMKHIRLKRSISDNGVFVWKQPT
jgi:hypothetical protein